MLRETTSRGLCGLTSSSSPPPPSFAQSPSPPRSLVRNRTQNSRVAGATQPPAQRGSGAHPGRGDCVKKGGGEEGEREGEPALGVRLRHSPSYFIVLS